MLTYHLLHDGFSEYEVGLALASLRARGQVRHIAPAGGSVVGEGGMRLVPDATVDDVDPQGADLLLISGTLDCRGHWDDAALFRFIRACGEGGAVVAAICGGPLFLAKAGLLEGRRYTCGIPEAGRQEVGVFEGGVFVDQDVVVDGPVITAKGYATVGFSLAIAGAMNLQGLSTPAEQQAYRGYWGAEGRGAEA